MYTCMYVFSFTLWNGGTQHPATFFARVQILPMRLNAFLDAPVPLIVSAQGNLSVRQTSVGQRSEEVDQLRLSP